MSEPDSIEAYLAELRRRLRAHPFLARRVLAEVADHVAEAVAAAERTGVPLEEAKRAAVARLGSAPEIAREFSRYATARAASLLGASGSLAVGILIALVVGFLLPAENANQIPFWSVTGIGFLAYGTLTWLYLCRGSQRLVRLALVIGSVAGVLVGLAAVGHSLYLAHVTGDWEAYVTLFGLILAGHAAALLAYFRGSQVDRAEPPGLFG